MKKIQTWDDLKNRITELETELKEAKRSCSNAVCPGAEQMVERCEELENKITELQGPY